MAETITSAQEIDQEPAAEVVPSRLAPLIARFNAWWEGEEYVPPDVVTAVPARGLSTPETPVTGWSEARIDVAERLWGEGFSTPGEKDYVLELVKPLALHNKLSALDIGVGLGGSTRTIATGTDAWVAGLEVDSDLRRAAMKRSKLAGLGRKAPIKHFTPPNLMVRDRSMDAVFCKEAMHEFADKEAMFAAIAAALKPQGQFLMTDYLLADSETVTDPVAPWHATVPDQVELWSHQRTVAHLQNLNLMIRVSEDISDRIKGMVLAGWRAYVRTLHPGALSPADAAAVIAEVERWTNLLSAFDSGALRAYRILAINNIKDKKRRLGLG